MKLCENKGYLLNYSQKSVVRTNIESNDRTLPLTRQGDQKGEYVQAGLKKTSCLLNLDSKVHLWQLSRGQTKEKHSVSLYALDA